MTVWVRNKANGGVVIGVSEVVAEGLLVSDDFELLKGNSPNAPAKSAVKKAAEKPSKK
jgi:hypothetical protein